MTRRSQRPVTSGIRVGAVKLVWLAFTLLATYVSIYPANFTAPGFLQDQVMAFLGSCCGRPSRGDVLGNVVLFVPFGFLGMLASPSTNRTWSRAIFVALIAVLFAFALQVLQLFLPTRDANLQDVIWNAIGTGVGIPIGAAAQRYARSMPGRGVDLALAPLLLVGAWLAYRLMPFVPSIDMQVFRDSLKPLLLQPDLSISGVVHDAAAWLMAAWLLRQGIERWANELFLPLLIGAVLFAEVLIVGNTVSASNAAGAIVAIAVWFVWLCRVSRPEPILLALLLVALVLWGLAPFEFRDETVAMGWLPFGGFLRGSMAVNAQSAAEKFFLYGSAVYLLWRLGWSRWAAVVPVALLVLAIEALQMVFNGHSPDITDPLLVLLAAAALAAVRETPAPERTPRSTVRRAR